MALLVAGLLALAAYWLLRPQHGLISRWRHSRRITDRIRREDALKHIHRCEMEGVPPTLHSLAGGLQISSDQAAELLAELQSDELVLADGGALGLTPGGRQTALHLLRAHRLWESHLASETGVPEVEWHGQAEDAEHHLSPDELQALDARLGHPERDPHGDPIPTAAGEVALPAGVALSEAPLETGLRIVHLEDEPEAVYAQLVAEGLYPGMEVRLIERTPRRLRFWGGGDEHVLAPIVAANLTVQPLPAIPAPAAPRRSLDHLRPGDAARVIRISPACRGAERRRLLDLGLLPGTVVSAAFTSPGGDPTAYLVRGATLALRNEQARFVEIEQ
jgi:DtxR family Mn-dependent transcriptional regulator